MPNITAKNQRILVVDDEAGAREFLRDILTEAGYGVTLASDGVQGLKQFYAQAPALVLLDLRMPHMDGWTLLERIREVSETPVIVLTALGEEADMVRGLTKGADDYLVKPFRGRELLARIDAVCRRASNVSPAENSYVDEQVRIDFRRHDVWIRGEKVRLSPLEYRLLSAFVSRRDTVLSSELLLDLCWGGKRASIPSVRVYIGFLRKKLEEDPERPRLIETVREFGYRYSAA